MLEVIFSLIGYYTARAIIPLASFGHLTVVPPTAPINPGKWRRLPDGRIGIETDVAAVIGVAFWLVIAAAIYFALT